MYGRGAVLIEHKNGMQPWERTLYVFVAKWLEERRRAELVADYEKRHGIRRRRPRGRPRSALRAPVNLRHVSRHLKLDYPAITYLQIARSLVEDIAPRLPARHRIALLGAEDGVHRPDVIVRIRRDLLRSRNDRIKLT